MSDFVETELGNLPESWLVTTVEDLVQEEVLAKPLDGNHGNIHPKGTDFVSEGIPFIMASDVNNGKVDLVNCKFISQEQADSLQKGFSKTGDVLLTHKASLGRTAIVQENPYPYIMLTPQVTYYRILDSSRLNNKYLKYYFDSPIFQDTLVNHGDSGSTRAYVGITAQRELPVIYPPIEIQYSIAQTLGSLDDKIDLLHRQNQTLEQMAETLYNAWFEESDFTSRVSDLIDLQNGYAFKSKSFQDLGEDRVLKIKNISGGIVDIETTDFVSHETVENLDGKFLISTGDILFAMTGAKIGKMGIIPKTDYKLWLNQRVGLFKEKYYGSRFLAYLHLKSDYGKDYIENTATGSAQPNISGTGIENCEFPEISEQEIIDYSNQLAPLYEKVIFNLGQIQKLEVLRNTLLPKLMSGEVKVSEL
ncbi:MAG: restriction endonuclease subunit S [Cyclobacteriaceae bacterium]|nr:restriction endonuclease subunit S [Cyclobacteriaceae bacterium]